MPVPEKKGRAFLFFQRSTPSARCTLPDAYELHLSDLQPRRLTESTIDFYKSKLLPFIRYCHSVGVSLLEELTH